MDYGEILCQVYSVVKQADSPLVMLEIIDRKTGSLFNDQIKVPQPGDNDERVRCSKILSYKT